MIHGKDALVYVLECTLESIELAVKKKETGRSFDHEWDRVKRCLDLIPMLAETTEDVHEWKALNRGIQCQQSLWKVGLWSLHNTNLRIVSEMSKTVHIHYTALWIIKGV